MKPLDFALLSDENIHPYVSAALLARGKNVTTVLKEGLGGQGDRVILRHAHAHRRVVLTHDADFGTLALHAGEPYIGIVYLRPGHVVTALVLQMLDALESLPVNVDPPFLIVVDRRGATVRVRVRAGS